MNSFFRSPFKLLHVAAILFVGTALALEGPRPLSEGALGLKWRSTPQECAPVMLARPGVKAGEAKDPRDLVFLGGTVAGREIDHFLLRFHEGKLALVRIDFKTSPTGFYPDYQDVCKLITERRGEPVSREERTKPPYSKDDLAGDRIAYSTGDLFVCTTWLFHKDVELDSGYTIVAYLTPAATVAVEFSDCEWETKRQDAVRAGQKSDL